MERIKVLHTDIYLAERWLKQMGEAASRNAMQLQYCMCLPRQLMAALQVPAVSHVSHIAFGYELGYLRLAS